MIEGKGFPKDIKIYNDIVYEKFFAHERRLNEKEGKNEHEIQRLHQSDHTANHESRIH